uniref:Uncharacterized protein n=1 Tax=Anguilla anguilla TaxID=7936 RepID=A0A0E9PJ41_ANGAN
MQIMFTQVYGFKTQNVNSIRGPPFIVKTLIVKKGLFNSIQSLLIFVL